MKHHNRISRRFLVKSSVAGLVAATVPAFVHSKNIAVVSPKNDFADLPPHDRYPAIQLSIAAEVVGFAHFDLEKLKQHVDDRPELAKANWDWGFGDWESPIAAASHVGRKDIVDYLIGKGATPTIFTYAVLGQYEAVKAMIGSYPGIQKNFGPHGISLLQHAKTALQTEGVDKSKAQQLIEYLQSLGDSDTQKYLTLDESEKTKYLGDYKYGEGKQDGFSIKLNMRKMISLGKLGNTGGALFRIGENEFTYQGAPSVTVKFLVQDGRVLSLTINEPGMVLTATKI